LREGQGTKKQIVRRADIPRSICLSILKMVVAGFSEILARISLLKYNLTRRPPWGSYLQSFCHEDGSIIYIRNVGK
jgi:hypothetical protein